MAEDAKGLVAALKDLTFSEFITTRLIKVLYVVGAALLALGSVGMIVTGFMQGFMNGVIGIVLAPIMFVIGIVLLRVHLEIVIVFFRIAENTGKMADASGATAPAAKPEKKAEEKAEAKEEEASDDDGE